jgi:cobalt-zinc-cadmium efflux system protein
LAVESIVERARAATIFLAWLRPACYHTGVSHPPRPENHAHGHGGAPGHVHVHPGAGAKGRAFAIGLGVNLIYMIAEIIAGLAAHSLALLADAAHNASDVLGLLAALIAGRLAVRAASATYTYGLRGASILAALVNASVLLVVTGGIAWEAVLRLIATPHVGGAVVMIIAAGGIAVNGGTALLFLRGQEDLNVRGAFLHMAGDAALSAATVAAGAIIWVTHWNRIDPVISLVVAVSIIAATWSLLRKSVAMSLDAVPEGLDTVEISAALAALPGVISVHDLHVWSVSTTETALTAHLVRGDIANDTGLLAAARHRLQDHFGIQHATLQLETREVECGCAFAAAG